MLCTGALLACERLKSGTCTAGDIAHFLQLSVKSKLWCKFPPTDKVNPNSLTVRLQSLNAAEFQPFQLSQSGMPRNLSVKRAASHRL